MLSRPTGSAPERWSVALANPSRTSHHHCALTTAWRCTWSQGSPAVPRARPRGGVRERPHIGIGISPSSGTLTERGSASSSTPSTRSSRCRSGIPLRERPTPRTRPIAPHNAEETMPLTAEGHRWVYLATVIDCYSKKVIAYAMDDHYKTSLITTAIRRAAHNEHLAPGAIFHTARGSNYTSQEFGTVLGLSLIHISEPTRLGMISYAVFCLKKKKDNKIG